MSRSLKKGPYINERLIAKIKKLAVGDKTVIKTWDRACTITPEMIGYVNGVNNCRQHIKLMISETMIGHKLCENSPTRKYGSHGGKMAKAQAKGK